MKIAIMQPYIFPYIGYFQLLQASDCFVMYDDVNFIKQGWVSRNRLLLNDKPTYFTVPLKKLSSFQTIKDTFIHKQEFLKWKKKFSKTLTQFYGKAEFFESTYEVIMKVLDTEVDTIGQLAKESIYAIHKCLNMQTQIVNSSQTYNNSHLAGFQRVIDICKKENITDYINPIGGNELYDKKTFQENGINLSFLKPTFTEYNQTNSSFVQGLSVIDILMHNSLENTRKMIEKYNLL